MKLDLISESFVRWIGNYDFEPSNDDLLVPERCMKDAYLKGWRAACEGIAKSLRLDWAYSRDKEMILAIETYGREVPK